MHGQAASHGLGRFAWILWVLKSLHLGIGANPQRWGAQLWDLR